MFSECGCVLCEECGCSGNGVTVGVMEERLCIACGTPVTKQVHLREPLAVRNE